MYGVLGEVFGSFESVKPGIYAFMKDPGAKKTYSIYETVNHSNEQ